AGPGPHGPPSGALLAGPAGSPLLRSEGPHGVGRRSGGPAPHPGARRGLPLPPGPVGPVGGGGGGHRTLRRAPSPGSGGLRPGRPVAAAGLGGGGEPRALGVRSAAFAPCSGGLSLLQRPTGPDPAGP